jgi:hypothetical protein
MTPLDRAALHTPSVSNRIQTFFSHCAKVQMILKQAAQQLPPDRLQLNFECPMLKPGRLPPAQPPNDLLKPLTRGREPTTAVVIGDKIPSRAISRMLALQDFIRRRVKYAATGAGVGDHEAHLPRVDVV